MTNNSINLSVNDFGKICRTCLAEGEMKFMYKNCSGDDCLLEMLMSVTLVQFTEKDGLPLQICLNCEKEAMRAYNFAQKCLEVDKKLKNCLKEFQTKIPNKTNSSTTETNVINSESPTNCQIQDTPLENEIVIEENTDEIEFEFIVIKPETLSQTENEHNYSGKQNLIKEKSLEIQEENDDNDDNFLQNENSETESISKQEEVIKKPVKAKIKKFGPPYVCKKCFKVFPTFKILKLHWQEVKHPPDSRTNCKTCNKSIHWSKLGQHMRTHTSEQAFACNICEKRFNIKANLKRHQMIHSGEKPHQCPHCEKAFIQSFHLNVHLRTHTGETPYKCDQCGKRFASKGNLRLHSRVHLDRSSERSVPTSSKFKCEICERFFKTKEILNSHKVIHGERRFLCSECGRSFYSNAALLSHSYLHTGLKPLTCNTCNKKFRHLSTLNVHKLLHTGKKPFECKVCDRKFTQRHHLTYHLRTHSGEKPYSCTFCDKSFALNNNLKVHVRTHTGETPYLCPICGKGFYDSSSMKKHKQGHSKHKVK